MQKTQVFYSFKLILKVRILDIPKLREKCKRVLDITKLQRNVER